MSDVDMLVAPPRTRLATAVVLLVLAALVAVVWVRLGDPDQGLDTTCGDFLAMSHDEQVEVLAGTEEWADDPAYGASYNREACAGHRDGTVTRFKG